MADLEEEGVEGAEREKGPDEDATVSVFPKPSIVFSEQR